MYGDSMYINAHTFLILAEVKTNAGGSPHVPVDMHLHALSRLQRHEAVVTLITRMGQFYRL